MSCPFCFVFLVLRWQRPRRCLALGKSSRNPKDFFLFFFLLCCQDGLVPSKTKIDIRGDLAFSRRGEDVPFPAGTARPRGRRYGQQAQLREGSRQGSLWSKHWPCLFCNAAHGEQMEHGPIDLRVTLLTACTREVFCRERPFPVW